MAEQPTELEQQFEKLQQLIQGNQHNKVIKLTDTSKKRGVLAPAISCRALQQRN